MAERVRASAVAEMTSLSVRTVLDLAVAGKIPGAEKISGVWNFNAGAVRRWISGQERAAGRDHLAKQIAKVPRLPVAYIVEQAAVWPPTGCGIYFLIQDSAVVYVGQSVDVVARVAQHAKDKTFDRWYWVPCRKTQLDLTERAYINALLPILNRDPETKRLRASDGSLV